MIKYSCALPERAWKQLLRGAQNGSQAAMDRLYAEASPIIKGIANSFKNSTITADEFYSEGCNTLVKIASNKKYSPDYVKNYILKSVKRRMIDFLRKENFIHKMMTSLDAAAVVENPDGTKALKTIGKNLIDKKATNPAEALFLKETLAKISTCSARKRKVFIDRLMGIPSGEIAKQLGITELYVNKIKERVLKELVKWQST